MITKIFGLILVSVLFTSCQRELFLPDKVNSPGFRRAGEGAFDISVKPQECFSGGGSPASFSTDAAYAPVDHLGVIASYRNVINRVAGDNYSQGTGWDKLRCNAYRIDIGAGYFGRIATKGKYEAYAGYGNGAVRADGYTGTESTNLDNSKHYDARYNRLFLQTAIGFSSRGFSMMGGARISFQKYYSFRSPDANLRYSLIPDGQQDLLRQTFGFIEPYIQMQAGGKYVSFIYQFGCALQTAGPMLGYELGAPFMSFGVALRYAPGLLKKGS